MRFYKGRYVIGLYDSDESCITVLDNCDQFADYLETSKKTASSILSRLMSGERTFLIVGGKMMSAHFIDMIGDQDGGHGDDHE